MRHLILGTALSLSLSSSAFADGFGCQRNAGATVFYDTLYGLATGAIFSGLYVWSKTDEKGYNRERGMANGTMIGGGIGLGFGIVEISLRNCSGGALGKDSERAGDLRFAFGALPSPDQSSLMSSASLRYIF